MVKSIQQERTVIHTVGHIEIHAWGVAPLSGINSDICVGLE